MADQTDWSPLRGKHVIVTPDPSELGVAYANHVARLVWEVGALSIKIVTLPGLKPDETPADWLYAVSADDPNQELHSLDEWDSLIDAAPFFDPGFRHSDDAKVGSGSTAISPQRWPCLSEIAVEPLEWVWDGVIPRGKVTVILGDAGVGKSLLMMDVVARVTRGETVQNDDERRQGNSVVVLSGGDSLADTVRPRLEAAGADLTHVFAIDAEFGFAGNRLTLLSDMEIELRRLQVAKRPARLMIVDPVDRYLTSAKTTNGDGPFSSAATELVSSLAKLASRYRVAIVLVADREKIGFGKRGVVTESFRNLMATSRSIWAIVRDPDHAQRRLLLPVKTNLREKTAGLAFSIEVGAVEWEADDVTITSEEFFAEAQDHQRLIGRSPAVHRAMSWLKHRLAAGPDYSVRLIEEGEQNDINKKLIRRAFHELDCQKRKLMGRWFWRLPGQSSWATVMREGMNSIEGVSLTLSVARDAGELSQLSQLGCDENSLVIHENKR